MFYLSKSLYPIGFNLPPLTIAQSLIVKQIGKPYVLQMTDDFIKQFDDRLHAKRVIFSQIPVIDLDPLLAGIGSLDDMAGDIHWALSNVGFMYIKNHGVTAGLTKHAFDAATRFFALPIEDKMNLHIDNSGEALRGYTEIFGENTDPEHTKDLKEVFDLGREAQNGKVRPFFGPNQWPETLPEFESVMVNYHNELMILARNLMRAIALSLGLPKGYFDPMQKEPVTIQRVLHYPSQQNLTDDSIIGIGAHTDYGCLTILAQDMIGGLQIMNRDGVWIEASPKEDTFVINIGDMMQRLTNDVYLANIHRVINTTGLERYSMPFFYDVDFDTVFEPLENCITPENPPRYDPIVCGEHKWSRYVKTFPHLKDT